VNGRDSYAFEMRVVHQESVLSSLLFIMILKALSREFKKGITMELLYAIDLVCVLMAET